MKSDPLFDNAPGPTPWWVPESPQGEGGPQFSWHAAGNTAPCAGKTVLLNAAGQKLLLADLYCWIRWFSTSHLLIWHQRRHDSSTPNPAVRMHVFEVAAFETLSDDACGVLDASPDLVLSQGGHVAAATFDAQLKPGRHGIHLPFPYSQLDELLVLVSPGRPHAQFHLWAVQPAKGVVDVIPQEWFNCDEYDCGYQWITRMVRDPQRRLIGEGIRLGVFRLDSSGRRVEEWLHRDPSWPFWYSARV